MLAGYVCLVGAGPGAPGLVTRLGLAYLRRAEVILYDHLASAALLLEVRADCELINVGKQGGKPSWKQETINQLLIAKAQNGKFVVRLKGGDPFLFGRGGEEARALVAAGIPYLFVPGISASLSVPAYAGIPVTDRQYAPGLVISTGHRAEAAAPDLRYTQVALMSLQNLATVVAKLLTEGYSVETPAMVIARGTTLEQRQITATLGTIESTVAGEELPAPALLVAGAAVGLAEILHWRQYLPLNGKRILWTRPDTGNDQQLVEDLELLGAEVIRLPTFVVRPYDPGKIVAILPKLRQYNWLVFTSGKAVEVLFDNLLATGHDWRYLENSRFAVIGVKTAATLRKCGRQPDLIAKEASSIRLGEALQAQLRAADRVALCQAEVTLPELADGLAAHGVDYTEFKLYHLICPAYSPDLLERIFAEPFDLAVFTAPVAIDNYLKILRIGAIEPGRVSHYACLGKATAGKLAQFGVQSWVIPAQPHLEELVGAILAKWEVDADVSGYPSA